MEWISVFLFFFFFSPEPINPNVAQYACTYFFIASRTSHFPSLPVGKVTACKLAFYDKAVSNALMYYSSSFFPRDGLFEASC